jgi:uncharacterized protein
MSKPSLAIATEIASQQCIALVGASRSGKKFANALGRELKERGCRVFYVHPSAETIEGERCYKSLRDLPETVGAALIVVRPARALDVLADAAAGGIKRVWLQKGAESAEALRFCEEHGMAAVGGYCMMMFAQPSYMPHTAHRCIVKLLGGLPA